MLIAALLLGPVGLSRLWLGDGRLRYVGLDIELRVRCVALIVCACTEDGSAFAFVLWAWDWIRFLGSRRVLPVPDRCGSCWRDEGDDDDDGEFGVLPALVEGVFPMPR